MSCCSATIAAGSNISAHDGVSAITGYLIIKSKYGDSN